VNSIALFESAGTGIRQDSIACTIGQSAAGSPWVIWLAACGLSPKFHRLRRYAAEP
jgi:hypothetical protein